MFGSRDYQQLEIVEERQCNKSRKIIEIRAQSLGSRSAPISLYLCDIG